MLTSKWSMLNANCQKFNALHKRAQSMCNSGENEMDVLSHVKKMFKDEIKGRLFNQDLSWDILRMSPKWDAPKWDAPKLVTIRTVNVEGTSEENADLFGQNKRARPPGARAAKKTKSESSSRTAGSQTRVCSDAMQNELRLKRESQQEKDRAVIKFEELWFLATRTDGLSPQYAVIIEMQ
ncbi:hypothetical protein Tco_1223710 [Tanacetum coccineum]